MNDEVPEFWSDGQRMRMVTSEFGRIYLDTAADEKRSDGSIVTVWRRRLLRPDELLVTTERATTR